MKQMYIGVCIASALLLTGCRYFPQPREMGDMALLRTIGIDSAEQGVELTVSTGPRAKGIQGEQQASLCLSAQGTSLSAAALEAQGKSENYLFFGYVDQLLLGEEEAGEMQTILDWFATEEELSLGAKLWVVRENRARAILESGGDAGVESRLSNLQKDGELGAAPVSRSAEEVYIALQEVGCAYVPTLILEEQSSEWRADGYAVLNRDGMAGFLQDKEARGLELLAEKPMAEILEVQLPDGAISVRVVQTQLACEPVFDTYGLDQLDLFCQAQVELTQQPEKLSQQEWEQIKSSVEIQLDQRIQSALRQLKRWKTDCIGLRGRVSLAAPWFWNTIQTEWPELFSAVTINTGVEVSLALGKG